jgi:hypothetical protein
MDKNYAEMTVEQLEHELTFAQGLIDLASGGYYNAETIDKRMARLYNLEEKIDDIRAEIKRKGGAE